MKKQFNLYDEPKVKEDPIADDEIEEVELGSEDKPRIKPDIKR